MRRPAPRRVTPLGPRVSLRPPLNRSGALEPLEAWLPRHTGLQAHYLVGVPTDRPFAAPQSCGAVAVAAQARLARVELVGVTSCLADFLSEIESRLGLPTDAALLDRALRRRVPEPTPTNPEVAAAVRNMTRAARREPRLRSIAEAAAACDAPIFARGAARFCSGLGHRRNPLSSPKQCTLCARFGGRPKRKHRVPRARPARARETQRVRPSEVTEKV